MSSQHKEPHGLKPDVRPNRPSRPAPGSNAHPIATTVSKLTLYDEAVKLGVTVNVHARADEIYLFVSSQASSDQWSQSLSLNHATRLRGTCSL